MGGVGGIGVDNVAVAVQHQGVVLVQVIAQGIVRTVGLSKGALGVALAVVVALAVQGHVGAHGVGGHSAADGLGGLDGLDRAGGHGDQDIVLIRVGVQVVKVIVGQGVVVGVELSALQGGQVQLAVVGVVVAVHLGHVGPDLGDGDVVVVVHEDLGQDAAAGALGVGGGAADNVVIQVGAAHGVAVDHHGQVGVAVADGVVGVAAHRVIDVAHVGAGGEAGFGGLGEGADLGAVVPPGDRGTAEGILTAAVLGQVGEVVLAELLHLVPVIGDGAVVIAAVIGDLGGGAGDHHGGAVGGGHVGAAAAGVGHHVGLQGLESHLGGVLTGDRVGQDQAGHGDACVGGVGGHVDGPVGAHIALGVGVVAQSHQAHLGEGQAGQLALGIKGAVAGAGQDALLRAVADVAGGPAVGGHVAEHHGVGGQALGIVAQEHAADDGRSLLTGQSTGGVKGTAVGALKDTEGGHHANRFGVGDFIGIGEITARSAGADNHHANDHDDCQKQAESPLEVTHFGFSSF